MPKYNYTAVDLQNKRAIAVLDARDEADLRAKLRNQDLVLIKARPIDERARRAHLRADETGEFSRQLASMLGSGITVVRAIEIMLQRDMKDNVRQVYQKLHRNLQQGRTLSEAMRLQGKTFPELLINMYASGEASGQLEQVSAKMAQHYEKEHRLNTKVKGAMTYPIILLIAVVIVVIAVFTLILPQFFKLFEGIELPFITRMMIAISGFLIHYWFYLIIGVLIVIAVFQALLTMIEFRTRFDHLKLRVPVAGKLLKIIYTARFARTLSSLYASGVSMISALDISATTIGNKYLESQFTEVVKKVRNGEPLSGAIYAVDGFDKKLSASILVGEESGRLDAMLVSVADSFDYEAEQATERLVRMLEPIMIVVMAVVVGAIMISVMLPIFTLYNNLPEMY